MLSGLRDWHVGLAATSLGAGIVLAAIASRRPRIRSMSAVSVAWLIWMRNGPAHRWVSLGVLLVGWFATVRPGRSRVDDTWAQLGVLVCLAGVWAAVPDTEAPLVAGCVLAPVLIVAFLGSAAPTTLDLVVYVVVTTGVALLGSAGWSEWVGGVGCGAVLAVALARGTRTRPLVRAAVIVTAAVVSSRAITRLDVAPALPCLAGLLVIEDALLRVGSVRAR